MNALIIALNQLSETWWPYVAHATWQSALVGGLLLAVVWFGRRWAAPLRYGLLLIALVKFAVPPMVSVPTGLFNWTGPLVPEVSRTAPILLPLPEESASLSDFEIIPPSEFTDEISLSPALTVPGPSLDWRAWLLLLHGIGCAAVLLWIAGQFVWLSRMSRRAHSVREGDLRRRFDALCRQIGLRRSIRLLISPDETPPIAFGVLRPTVMIPSSVLKELSSQEIDTILAHELAHHRRADTWINWFQILLAALWWFNPVVWLLNRAVRKTREDCCDDLLLSRNVTTTGAYCDALLRAASRLSGRVPAGAVLGFAERLHPLADRLRRIMDQSLRRSPRLSVMGILVVIVMAGFLLPGLPGAKQGEGDVSSEEVTESSITSPSGLNHRLQGPIVASQTPLNQILTLLGAESGLRFSVDQGMNPKVTFSLESPTVREVLDIVLSEHDLDYLISENRDVRIGVKNRIILHEPSNLVTQSFSPKHISIDSLKEPLSSVKTDMGQLIFEPDGNRVFATDMPKAIGAMSEIVEKLDVKRENSESDRTIQDIEQKVARVRADFKHIETALESFFLDNSQYPVPKEGHTIDKAAGLGPGERVMRLTAPIAYMQPLPKDPFDPDEGTYRYNSNGSSWCVLVSNGPDMKPDFNVADYPSISQAKLTYAPSNGLNSAGDMFHLGTESRASSPSKESPRWTLGREALFFYDRFMGEMAVEDTPLHRITVDLSRHSRRMFFIDDDIDPKVTFHLESPTSKEVLDAILPGLGLDYLVTPFAVRIGTVNTIAQASKTGPARRYVLRKDRGAKWAIDANPPGILVASKIGLEQVLTCLHEAYGYQFAMQNRINPEVTFLYQKGWTFRKMLDSVLPEYGLDYLVTEHDTVCIASADLIAWAKTKEPSAPREGRNAALLGIQIEGPIVQSYTSLKEIVDLLSAGTYQRFSLAENVNPRMTFALESPTLGAVLDTILPPEGLVYRVADSGIIHISAKAGSTIPRQKSSTACPALDHRIQGPMTASQTDLDQILMLLGAESGLKFAIDPGIAPKVSFSLESPTVREVLDTALPSHGLDYIINENGTIRIGYAATPHKTRPTSAFRSNEESSTASPGLDYRLQGPIEASQAPLNQILMLLGAESGFRFSVDQGINPQVSFSLESPTVREVLEAILPGHGLDYLIFEDGS
ncbi:MAG: M56 family metallopeptidase, partial [bacterium]